MPCTAATSDGGSPAVAEFSAAPPHPTTVIVAKNVAKSPDRLIEPVPGKRVDTERAKGQRLGASVPSQAHPVLTSAPISTRAVQVKTAPTMLSLQGPASNTARIVMASGPVARDSYAQPSPNRVGEAGSNTVSGMSSVDKKIPEGMTLRCQNGSSPEARKAKALTSSPQPKPSAAGAARRSFRTVNSPS